MKSRLLKDHALTVLGLLLALTLLSWGLLFLFSLPPKALGVLLLVLAFVKVQVIISQYMELNSAILPIRIAFWMWTIIVASISIAMYLR